MTSVRSGQFTELDQRIGGRGSRAHPGAETARQLRKQGLLTDDEDGTDDDRR